MPYKSHPLNLYSKYGANTSSKRLRLLTLSAASGHEYTRQQRCFAAVLR